MAEGQHFHVPAQILGEPTVVLAMHWPILVSRNSDSRHNSWAAHPAWRRCPSLRYTQYLYSSRLASRARRSTTYATYHCSGTLVHLMNRHDVPSQWIDSPRRVTVWTPDPGPWTLDPGRCPLLILHDGQNLFDPDRAHRAGHTWQVAETAAKLIEERRIPPMVIAGIDHAEEARLMEMTPTEGDHPGAGHVGRY